MRGYMNLLVEADVFAEEVIGSYFYESNINYFPSSFQRNPYYVKAPLNPTISRVVYFFSIVPKRPCYRANHFPNGYNALDFLAYCGRIASEAIRDYKCGNEDAGYDAENSISSCLREFILSGEFQRNGGWPELRELCSKLVKYNVFLSVVCISNELESFRERSTASAQLQTSSPGTS